MQTVKIFVILCFIFLFTSCNRSHPTEPSTQPTLTVPLQSLIPIPMSVQTGTGSFSLTEKTQIYVYPGTADAIATGNYLGQELAPATGFNFTVTQLTSQTAANSIILTTAGADQLLGEEGYTLTVTTNGVTITALNQTGIFWGIQTLMQLFPASIESSTRQSGPWEIPVVTIKDMPRFAWRGFMLDVARHFFSVSEVERVIDEMACFKLNRLHLHLTDDQGWRIEIESWPNLTSIGGSTEVGGGPGGYYTQAQYVDIVNYAESRHIIVVPEIDMPGHCNAALASYPDLNADGQSPALYTGIETGFSAMAVHNEITYSFIDDVVRELAAITPGPYIHIGGDEASTLSDSDYAYFVQRVQAIVQVYGKQCLGWEPLSMATLLPSTTLQHWYTYYDGTEYVDYNGYALAAVSQGAKILMSSASKTYLELKYNTSTQLGSTWAGMIEVKDGYNWDPATELNGITESEIIGVEPSLWTETIVTMSDLEFMTFPRLLGYAEIGWLPQASRNWNDYGARLANYGPRLTAMGINFYKSSQVDWK